MFEYYCTSCQLLSQTTSMPMLLISRVYSTLLSSSFLVPKNSCSSNQVRVLVLELDHLVQVVLLLVLLDPALATAGRTRCGAPSPATAAHWTRATRGTSWYATANGKSAVSH